MRRQPLFWIKIVRKKQIRKGLSPHIRLGELFFKANSSLFRGGVRYVFLSPYFQKKLHLRSMARSVSSRDFGMTRIFLPLKGGNIR